MTTSLFGFALVALSGASGCSLIYNPSNLPDPLSDGTPLPDLMPDLPIVPVDADPALLEITDVSPRELLEGQGVDGSRRAVVFITGVNIINGATVAITAHAGATGTPLITVDNTAAVVSTDGLNIAVPVLVEVDPLIGPGTATPTIRLDVSVTQPTATDPVTKTLTTNPAGDPLLTLTGLEEHLTGALEINLATNPPKLFSQINATTVTFIGSGQLPTLQAVSSITIADPISVNGSGITAGPGGGNGGAGGTGGAVNTEAGNPGSGAGAGSPNAGGGGFGEAGGAGAGAGGGPVGTANLSTLASPNRGSGGAGAEGPILSTGGAGGGGGGTILVTAGGTLSFNQITASGGNGSTAAGNTGGGGSGGAVVVRAGGAITSTTGISALGGTGGNGGVVGAGGAGR
ncbi:MAG: hypothetical protein H0V17_26460, partial [Deltaproteobacteria bacterium]|nr:hypothetical protein [Deltaproteobacteria bacterium]